MEDRTELVKYALVNAGNRYPTWHLLGIAIAVIVKKVFRKNIPNILSSEESICSKLTILVLEILGYDIRYTDKQINKTTPADVERLVQDILNRGKGGTYVL